MDTIVNNTSLLYGCRGDVNQPINNDESIMTSLLLIAIICTAIFGNVLVICAILRVPKLRVPKNSFLCSLAFLDLLLPLLRVAPIAISTVDGYWLFGCTFCMISSATGVFFCAASILHLCAITVERYVTIHYPHRKSLISSSNISLALLLIWSLSLVMALIPYLTSSVELHFNRHVLTCEFYLGYTPYLSLLLAFIYFCLPSVLMVVLYYRIYHKLYMSNRKVSAYQVSHDSHKRRSMKEEWRTVKMVMVIIGSFFGLWLPYFTIVCVKSYHPNGLPGWVERMAFICAYMNSCNNFIVYTVMNKRLRAAFKQILVCPIHADGNQVHALKMTMKKPSPREERILDIDTNKDGNGWSLGSKRSRYEFVVRLRSNPVYTSDCIIDKEICERKTEDNAGYVTRRRGRTF